MSLQIVSTFIRKTTSNPGLRMLWSKLWEPLSVGGSNHGVPSPTLKRYVQKRLEDPELLLMNHYVNIKPFLPLIMSFLESHPGLGLWKPEETSWARVIGYKRVAVSNFFDLLNEVLDKHKLDVTRIFNCNVSMIPKQFWK